MKKCQRAISHCMYINPIYMFLKSECQVQIKQNYISLFDKKRFSHASCVAYYMWNIFLYYFKSIGFCSLH